LYFSITALNKGGSICSRTIWCKSTIPLPAVSRCLLIIESSKLDYINWKLGFFYDGHRALNDCWATLNLFLNEEGSFDELKANVRKKEVLICPVNTSFDKKDILKQCKYNWSDGLSGRLPKCWWTCVPQELINDEKRWLDEEIYCTPGASDKVPQLEINALKRYSLRAEIMT